MKRKLFAQLIIWKDSLQKKPLLLTGAKGTGKTFLALTLAKSFYKRYIYINLELQADKDKLAACFERFQLTGENIGLTLIESPVDEGTENSLIILDNISCMKDLNMLNTLARIYPGWDIFMVSGYLSPIDSEVYSDNECTTLKLHPLDFDEFLDAAGQEWYVEVINESVRKNKSLPVMFQEELWKLFENYLIVGGLPAVVNEYINNDNTENIAQMHSDILYSYFYQTEMREENCALKVRQMLYTLPLQLSKHNKKFQFNQIRKGATENLYKDSLSFIKNSCCGIICPRLSDEIIGCNKFDGINYESTPFKLYLYDVGLYHSLSKLTGINQAEGFREGLVESYIAQVLTGANIPFGYWETASGSHSLFMLMKALTNEYPLLPLEIRTKLQKRSKLLLALREKQPNINQMLTTSDAYRNTEAITTIIPLYGIKNIIDNLILFR